MFKLVNECLGIIIDLVFSQLIIFVANSCPYRLNFWIFEISKKHHGTPSTYRLPPLHPDYWSTGSCERKWYANWPGPMVSHRKSQKHMYLRSKGAWGSAFSDDWINGKYNKPCTYSLINISSKAVGEYILKALGSFNTARTESYSWSI